MKSAPSRELFEKHWSKNKIPLPCLEKRDAKMFALPESFVYRIAGRLGIESNQSNSLTKSSSGLEAPPTKNNELFMVSGCPRRGVNNCFIPKLKA